jgi:hypothetical protein
VKKVDWPKHDIAAGRHPSFDNQRENGLMLISFGEMVRE